MSAAAADLRRPERFIEFLRSLREGYATERVRIALCAKYTAQKR